MKRKLVTKRGSCKPVLPAQFRPRSAGLILTRKKLRSEIEQYLRDREDPFFKLKSFKWPKWVLHMVLEYDSHDDSARVLVVVTDSSVKKEAWQNMRSSLRELIRAAIDKWTYVSFRPESEHRELESRINSDDGD